MQHFECYVLFHFNIAVFCNLVLGEQGSLEGVKIWTICMSPRTGLGNVEL